MSHKSFWSRILPWVLMLTIVLSPMPMAQQARAQEPIPPGHMASSDQVEQARKDAIWGAPTAAATFDGGEIPVPQLLARGDGSMMTVVLEGRPSTVEGCYEWIWDNDNPDPRMGTWDQIVWAPSPTQGKAYADLFGDGAMVTVLLRELPEWGAPNHITYTMKKFTLNPPAPGATMVIETVVAGQPTGLGWQFRSEELSQIPSHFQVDGSDYRVNGAVLRTDGHGRQLGWDDFRLFKCYDGVPVTPPATNTPVPTTTPTRTPSPTPTRTPTDTATPTRTPSPTPAATPTVADDTLWLATPAPVVQVDNEGDKCRIASLPIAGGTGQARVPETPDSWPNSNPQLPALRDCFSPSQVAWIPPGQCLNPTRRLVAKNSPDGNMAFSIEFQCNSQGGAVMLTSTSAGTNPIVGPIVGFAALSMMALSASPHYIEVFWEPAGNAVAEGGRFLASSIEEAKDALLAMAVKPSTIYLGQPTYYAQIFEGQEDIAALFRGYRSTTNWEQMVWVYPASAGVDGNTVAALQSFAPGPHGPVLKTFIYKNVPSGGGGYPLWDAVVQSLLGDYPTEPLYPGVPARTGEHSDPTPNDTARKMLAWARYMNLNWEFVQAGLRPPHNWCGIRDVDNTCVCANYTIQVFRWVINGAGKVVSKWYEGAALVWNPENPTVLPGIQRRVHGAADFTDGAKPKGRPYDEFRTLDLNNLADVNKCPPHFGLRLAGAVGGIPASMLPEGGETQ